MEIEWNSLLPSAQGSSTVTALVGSSPVVSPPPAGTTSQDHDPIVYNGVYRVQICREHRYAIQRLKAHLQDKHSQLQLTQRRAITLAHQDDDLCHPPDVPLPLSGETPITELGTPISVFQCSHHSCQYRCRASDQIRKHANQKHEWYKTTSCPTYWTHVYAQTFFIGSLTKYFIVDHTPTPAVSPSGSVPTQSPSPPMTTPVPATPLSRRQQQDIQQMKHGFGVRRQVRQREQERLDANMIPQDRTGWFNITQWPQHFAGRHLGQISRASRLPDKDEEVLTRVVETLNHCVIHALHGLDSFDRELKRWLKSPRPTEPDVRPFARLQNPNSQDRYINYVRRFLCMVVRVWCSEQEYARNHQPSDGESSADPDTETDEDDGEGEQAVEGRRHGEEEAESSDQGGGQSDMESEGEGRSEVESDGESGSETGGHGGRGDRSRVNPHPTRPVDRMQDARELFPWTSHQRQVVGNMYQSMLQQGEEDEDEDEGERATTVWEVLRSFIFQKVGGEDFKSGLVHFTAVLGIDEENIRLRSATDYSYMLAGLVWSTRLLGAELLWPYRQRREQIEEDAGQRAQFLAGRQQYLADGTGTPMSKMLSLLAYGKNVAMNTGNAGTISWSRDQETMFYRGRPISMTGFRQMVSSAIRDAEDLLWERLMWTERRQDRWVVSLEDVEDDKSFTMLRYSFISKESNGFGHGLDWMLARLHRHNRGPRRLRARGRWRAAAVRLYLRQVQEFRALLLFCVHLTAGQPARGTEIESIRWCNGSLQDRNVFVEDGQVMIVTRYHKSQALFDTPKIVPRFLTGPVEQLLLLDLIYLRPFEEAIADEVVARKPMEFVWYTDQGCWDSIKLRKIIQERSQSSLGHSLGILAIRHIMVGIGREKADSRFAVGYAEEIGEVEELEQEDESILELQSGRGEAMGAQRYAVKSDIVKNLTPQSIAAFRDLSRRWHQFLGLPVRHQDGLGVARGLKRPAGDVFDPPSRQKRCAWRAAFDITSPADQRLPPPPPPPPCPVRWDSTPTLVDSPDIVRGRSVTDDLLFPHPCSKSISDPSARPDSHPHPTGSPFQSPFLSVNSYSLVHAREKMQQLFGGSGPAVAFRSPAQEAGLGAVLRLESPLVVVLPTGGGKTLLAQVPALLDPHGVSVMVVPFRALIEDMVQRFRQARIPCFEWTGGETNPTRMVFVSADIAVGSGFMTYARGLREAGLLRRIFFDECHTTFKDSHWRSKLDQVRQLRGLGCQTICLTATLPPTSVYELEQSMAVSHARIIRSSTVRPQHRYLVQRCPPPELESQAVSICRRRAQHLRRGQKAVVYGKSRAFCEALAEQLQCIHYHSQIPDRALQLARWVAEGGFIVATSALGTGVDFPQIVFILHVDMPWSMIDFAQESGRGGRAGELVDSVILVPEKAVESRMERVTLAPDTLAMARFITTTEDCRRFQMSGYMDGADLAVRCRDVVGAAHCDRCGEGWTDIQAQQQRQAHEWRHVRTALDELSQSCVFCWVTEEEGVSMGHLAHQCTRHPDIVSQQVEQFRRWIVYPPDSHSCFRCGISQRLCATGEDSQAPCPWHNILVPMVYVATGHRISREIIARLGFGDIPDNVISEWARDDIQRYCRWLAQRHIRRVWGENMSNAMAVLISVVLYILGVDQA